MGETAWGTPAGECRVPLSPNLQESSSAQGPAVRSRPSSPSSKSLRGQWPRDGGCGYRVRGGVLPSPVRGGGSPSLCGPRQRCPRNPPGAEKPDTDPSPGPDAAPPVSPQSVPSGPGVGLAQPGHGRLFEADVPATSLLVPAPSSCTKWGARLRAPLPHPGPTRRRLGRSPRHPGAPGATSRGGAPQRRPLSGSAGLRPSPRGPGAAARGSPYPRARPSEPLDAPGPFCLGLCGPRPGPLPGRSRVLPGPLAGPCPPAALLPCGELGALGRALGGPRAARPGRAAGNARRPSPARSGGRREGAGGREEEERGGRREEGARHGGRRKTRAGSARAGAGAPGTRVPAGTRAARSGAQHAEKGLRRQPQVGRLGSLT